MLHFKNGNTIRRKGFIVATNEEEERKKRKKI